jgi:type I restriction enzyme S subunit
VMGSGELPEGWVCAEIGDVTERAEKIDPRNTPDRIIRYIDISSIDNKRFRIAGPSIVKLSEAPSRARQLIREGDTLFSLVRPYLKNIAFVDASLDGEIASTGFCVLRSNGALDPKFLFYRAISQDFVNSLSEGQYGVSYPAVNEQQVRAQLIAVAPLNEQRRIVEKIETLFAELDKGEESLRQVQTLLARYRQSVLKAAVTGELTADWRARHAGKLEHGRDLLARILKARRENWQGRGKYKEPVEPDTANLLELPDGWVWASLSQITWIKGGITVDKKRNPTNPITLPYLRVANVQNGYLDLSHVREITVEAEKAEECLLKPGDILLNEGGDRDKLGRGWVWSGEIERCIHQNHVFRARPVLAELSSKFVSFYANAFGQPFFMQKGKQSVNLASISLTAISGLPIPLPPVEEQREIVELLEDKLGEIGQLEKACEHELSRSSALRRSVLRHAFAGKLVPQDLNDEPASKLLERIRSQRETANCKTTREAVTA